MSGLLRAFCASERRKRSVTICRMTVWFHAKRLFYRFAAPDGNCKTCRLGPADSLCLGAGVCCVIGPSLARSQAGARRCPRPGSWACLRLTGVSHVPKREQSRLSRARSPHKGGSRKCVTFPPARDRRDPWRRSPGGRGARAARVAVHGAGHACHCRGFVSMAPHSFPPAADVSW